MLFFSCKKIIFAHITKRKYKRTNKSEQNIKKKKMNTLINVTVYVFLLYVRSSIKMFRTMKLMHTLTQKTLNSVFYKFLTPFYFCFINNRQIPIVQKMSFFRCNLFTLYLSKTNNAVMYFLSVTLSILCLFIYLMAPNAQQLDIIYSATFSVKYSSLKKTETKIF